MVNTSKKPWYETAVRWGQTNLTEDDPALCDLAFWKKQWKRTKVQGLIINCGGIVAYYPSKYPLQYRAASMGDKDYYGQWNDAAREAGLAVIARMDINRATKDFYDAHPDWFCVDKNGKPILSQGRYFSCVNSGYYTEYIPDVLREIIERYHPDGFSDNSWKGMERHTICYCENCKTKFKRATGLDLPESPNWDDPAYGEWIRWSYQTRTDNWDLFNKVTMEAGGEDCLWLGMLHADPANISGGFGDLKALCARSKVIFSDHQSRDLVSGFEQNSVNGNLLRLASPSESTVVPESMANYTRGSRAFRLAANPQEETRLWSIEGVAGGISPWYHHVGGGQNDSRQFETPVELFTWHEQQERYLFNRENSATVGVVWNQENADFYGRNNAKERVFYPWVGFCRAMAEHRIPFLPVHASDIGKYADRLSTLILPDVAVLSAEQEDAVLAFLNKGGSLVVSGMAGTLDQNGNPKGSSRILDAIGMTLTGENYGEFGSTKEGWENYSVHTYFRLPEERHAMLGGFEDTGIVAFGGGLRGVKSAGKLQQICSYIPPFPIYPPEFSWIQEERPDIGTVFAGDSGKGGRVVYLAADIDRCFGRTMLPDHGALLSNAVKWAAGDLPLTVTGPGYLDCSLYRQGDAAILHLVNLSGASHNAGYTHAYYPVGPLEVSVKTAGNPKKASLKVAGVEVPVTCRDGYAVFSVSSIVDHEMIVVE
jgi:hypothetical protein